MIAGQTQPLSIQSTLSGGSIVDTAIKRLQDHEPEEGYYLAFSGGKDSCVIYDLALRAGVKFDAHFSVTTVDPPEVYQFIREHYPGVTWEKPRKSMYSMISEKGMLPTRLIRFCCSELKEIGGAGRTVITGIRWAESVNRKNRKVFEESRKIKGKLFLHPILDWSNTDVWDYIRLSHLPYCPLYDEGKTRLGCIMCPMQGETGMRADSIRYPRHFAAYKKALLKAIKAGKGPFAKTGENIDQIMEWWITGKRHVSPMRDETR